MTEEDFDEDVIFPNSPLSQYLQNLEDSECANLIEKDSSEIAGENLKSYKSELKPESTFNNACLLSRCKTWAHFIGSLLCLPYYIVFSTSLFTWSLLKINIEEENELLIPEDKAFLDSLLKSENALKDKERMKYTILDLLRIWGIIAIICWTSYYFAAPNKDLFEVFYIFFIVICTYATLQFFGVCAVVYSKVLDIQYIEFYKHLIQILKLLKRCIRLVQESELTARGFTVAASVGAAERIELSTVLPLNSANKQCLKLRQSLFKWMKGIFLNYKAETLSLIQNVPLDPLYDFSTCLAQLEIEEFGAFLTHDIDSAAMVKLTDGFSISSLKTMYRLMEMQISEYFRSALVVLFFISENKKKDCCEQIWDLYNIKRTMSGLSKASKPLLDVIGKTYHYYQSIEASYVYESEKQSPKTSKTPSSKLKVTVHNMCLHLKAALLRAVEAENCLHSASSSSLDQVLKSVDSLIQVVNSEISAFHDSSKESSDIISDLLHPHKKSSDEVISLHKSSDPDDGLPKVLEKCDIEREIEDEVFEGMISASECSKSERLSSHSEEAKKDVEIAAHLLSELKNVLVPKADEHRIREQKALEKRGKDSTENQASESEIDGTLDSTDATADIEIKPEEKTSDGDTLSLLHQEKLSSEILDSIFSSTEPLPVTDSSPKPNESFAAAIASMAAQRQKMFGLSSDEYVVEGSECSNSDSE